MKAIGKFIKEILIGILNVGLSNDKIICRFFDYDFEKIRSAGVEELSSIDNVGEVIAKSIVDYFAVEENNRIVDDLITYLNIEKPETNENSQTLSGKTFVITGSLNHFENRNALKDIIEERGGKVAGSVSKNTECLINNDVASNSSKNKKAKDLGVMILSEDDFMAKYLQ